MLQRDIVFALPLLEPHDRDLTPGGEPLDRGDELLTNRVRQTRRGERRTAMLCEEAGDPRRVGQLGHVRVAVDAIDAVQLEHHVLAEHLSGRQG
jgi:hypothetical protein